MLPHRIRCRRNDVVCRENQPRSPEPDVSRSLPPRCPKEDPDRHSHQASNRIGNTSVVNRFCFQIGTDRAYTRQIFNHQQSRNDRGHRTDEQDRGHDPWHRPTRRSQGRQLVVPRQRTDREQRRDQYRRWKNVLEDQNQVPEHRHVTRQNSATADDKEIRKTQQDYNNSKHSNGADQIPQGRPEQMPMKRCYVVSLFRSLQRWLNLQGRLVQETRARRSCQAGPGKLKLLLCEPARCMQYSNGRLPTISTAPPNQLDRPSLSNRDQIRFPPPVLHPIPGIPGNLLHNSIQ